MKNTNFYKILFLIILLFTGINKGESQVLITSTGGTPEASAMLEIDSDSKGILIPRIDFNDKPASPVTGLLIYVIANGPVGNNAFYYYDSSVWIKIVTGDSETDPIFTTWDKSTGIYIKESQISDFGAYLTSYTETQNLNNVLTISNSAGNNKITNLAYPVNDQDAVTKAYVDALEERISILEGTYIVTDYDGNEYSTIKIGNQLWMAEDLRVTHYPNGDPIPNITDVATWSTLADINTDDAYCFYNNDNTTDYGALYTYAAAIGDDWTRDNSDGQGVCLDGWHFPTYPEWLELITYLGGTSVAGGKMKETGITHWNSPNTGASNESGFLAIPGGFRTNIINGDFVALGNSGYFWVAFESNHTSLYMTLNYDTSSVFFLTYPKGTGFSVRCLRD